MKLALVGATGLVGTEMLKVLDEFNVPVEALIPVGTEKSIGKEVSYKGQHFKVTNLEAALLQRPDFALFSAGGSVSLDWAPKFAAVGTTVIDNSSAWRMHPDIKLVVPEINAEILTQNDRIIANPNCSTIQMVMVLWPLHKAFGLKRVVVSTYQSVTGTGVKAIEQLENERNGNFEHRVYPHRIDLNLIPQCDVFAENRYTKEEMKLINEPRKIMGLPDLAITSTAVRVPVMGGHSESVNIEFERPFEMKKVLEVLEQTSGVIVQDNPEINLYPMPYSSRGKNEVFVGRIRRDESLTNGLNLWIVSDNLRKGAATNAVQILEYLNRQLFLQP